MNKYYNFFKGKINFIFAKEQKFSEFKGPEFNPLHADCDGYFYYENNLSENRWLEKYQFEKMYIKLDSMLFGIAMEALKNGNKVARAGWVDKGVYIKLIQGHPVNGHLHPAIGKYHDDGRTDSDTEAMFNIPDTNPDGSPNITQGKPGQMLSHIVMKTAGDSAYWGVGFSDYVPWFPSQIDILSDDWELVE